MRSRQQSPIGFRYGVLRLALFLGGLLTLKTLAGVLIGYRNYFPPNFANGFLLGRDEYFWGWYHWTFYLHLIAGPFTLAAGSLLMSASFRTAFPGWHRRLGRCQVMVILGFLVPTGLGMSFYANAGPIAVVGFVLLSISTGFFSVMGWTTAVRRQFAAHRIWMVRCYLCLWSAVLIRLNGGLGEVLDLETQWYYAQAAWSCWLLPLTAFEIGRRIPRKTRPAANSIPINSPNVIAR